MQSTVSLSSPERAQWSIFAQACYGSGRNALGHQASVGSAVGVVRRDTCEHVRVELQIWTEQIRAEERAEQAADAIVRR